MEKKAIIVGAGPAGLTAAYELLIRTDIKPIILEKSGDIGGISKTINYKGNRIDIGGHRFFSKSDRVMRWWMKMMPLEGGEQTNFNITYQNKSRDINSASLGAIENAGTDPDKVMLVRQRLSRIYFLRKFFTYPIQLSFDTLTKLGLWTTIAIMFSYLKAQLLPRRPEATLEDFMINRFGFTLYNLFFKDYTEKVWGVPCKEIPALWGAQRIKGISISKAIRHAIQSATKRSASNDISQKGIETSLIEQFLYPKYGPGQLWEEVARQVESMGGRILMHHDVKRIYTTEDGSKVTAIAAVNNMTGETSYLEGDYFFSTMPVKELIGGMDGAIPQDVKEIAAGLQYRDFITVGILLKRLSHQDKKTGEWKPLELKDTWIYIQEKDVKVGRLQLFNNWSPYLVKDPDTMWVGMEFFCNTTDSFWQKKDEEIKQLAIRELEKIGLASQANVLDATVLRVEKTYPAYFGAYEHFDRIREYVDGFANLFLVGRNGMHKYNNSDHSMLTAMVAVDNIAAGITSKENIWSINTEQDYHEEKVAKKSNGMEAIENPELADESPNAKTLKVAFADFVLKDDRNKEYLYLALISLIGQFILFKIFYPYADFFSDSYNYIFAAAAKMNVNIWPIGYSWFLYIFHGVTHSDIALIGFQFFFVGLAEAFFFFTVRFLYKPTDWTSNILFIFLFFNPLYLYLSNYVSSDALFLGLSLLWLTQLLWLIHHPRGLYIIINAILILFAFCLRYNAMYYPLVAAVAFGLSKHRPALKMAGIVLPILLLLPFIQFTRNKTYEVTGTRQFSVFSGWQMANNALYMYSHIEADSTKVPTACRKVDQITRRYFDTIPAALKDISPATGAHYIKDPAAPLKYYSAIMLNEVSDTTGGLKAWGLVSPVFAEYGKYLIQQHPVAFARYYLLPNTINYFLPPLEKLEIYNLGMDEVAPIAAGWFNYRSTVVESPSKTIQGILLQFFPFFFMVINLYFIGTLIWFWFAGRFHRSEKSFQLTLLLTGFTLVTNIVFSIFASPIVFRYQVFPMILYFTFLLLVVEKIYITEDGLESKKSLFFLRKATG